MQRAKWEYLKIVTIVNGTIVNAVTSEDLNQLGSEGWELVAVTAGSFYFKRQLKP